MSLFERFLSTGAATAAFTDEPLFAAMLRFEATLALEQAALGLIPAEAAKRIAACCEITLFDTAALLIDARRAGSVAIPLIAALKAKLPADLRACAHFGCTSQDVIDTAQAMQSKAALEPLQTALALLTQALRTLALAHAATPILARTLMQPASVTSFGLKCLNWLEPLERSAAAIGPAMERALCVQLGGAVGTSAGLDDKRDALAQAIALKLGLAARAQWHTQRDDWLRLGSELALLAANLGKIATDWALLSQFEIGELAEPHEAGRGGSSAMPHKQNAVASSTARAAALRAPQHAAAMLCAAGQHEHERALGAWQAELAEWPALLCCVAGSVDAMSSAASGLQVFQTRMLKNIEAVRTSLPEQDAAARSWFDPALAQHCAQIVQARLA